MKATPRVLIFVFICSLATLSSAETLRVGGIKMPPWSMSEGENGAGVNIDVFREAAKRAGYGTTYKVLPFKRKIAEFREDKIDVDPGTNPNWRRDDQEISVYSIPFYESVNVVLVRRGRGLRVESARDFAGARLGCLLGYRYTDGFQEAFAGGRVIREDVTNHESNIKKLNGKRVDGVIIDKVTGLYLIAQLGLNMEEFDIAYTFTTKSVLYMRIHIRKKHILPALNAALEAMKAEGAIQKIVEKYTR